MDKNPQAMLLETCGYADVSAAVGHVALEQHTEVSSENPAGIMTKLDKIDDPEAILVTATELYADTKLSPKVIGMAVLYARGLKATEIIAAFDVASPSYVTRCVKKTLDFLRENPNRDPDLATLLHERLETTATRLGRRKPVVDSMPGGDKKPAKLSVELSPSTGFDSSEETEETEQTEQELLSLQDIEAMVASGSLDPVGSDSLKIYMNQVGRRRRLSDEETFEYATRVQSGIAARNELEGSNDIEPKRRHELERLVQTGDQARIVMIESNLRLVVTLAKLRGASKLPLLDRIQAGNIGLMRAVEQFDPTRGIPFGGYARIKIKERLARTIDNEAEVQRLPVPKEKLLRSIATAERDFIDSNHRSPTVSELADILGLTAQKIAETNSYRRKPVSLEDALGNSEQTLMSVLDPTELSGSQVPTDIINRKISLRTFLDSVLEPDEVKLLDKCYGLTTGVDKTGAEVAKEYGLTIRTINFRLSAVFNKLRDSEFDEVLRSILD